MELKAATTALASVTFAAFYAFLCGCDALVAVLSDWGDGASLLPAYAGVTGLGAAEVFWKRSPS